MFLSHEEIQVVPWEEAYQATLTGNKTGVFSTVRIPDRESSFKWVGPISMERYVLFSALDPHVLVKSPEDLKALWIGAIAGDASLQLLRTAGIDESLFVTDANASELIEILEKKEIDLWASPECTGRYYAELMTGDYYPFNASCLR